MFTKRIKISSEIFGAFCCYLKLKHVIMARKKANHTTHRKRIIP